jgi:hypothetical protein
MKRFLHWYAIAIFLLVLGYDFVVWGAAARLPDDVGRHLLSSARREAPLVDFYMHGGELLDQAVPALDAWGSRAANAAFADGFARIKEDPAVAMDLIFSQTWNTHHAMLKFCHWAAPALALISLVLWLRRPKKVRMMGGGRR